MQIKLIKNERDHKAALKAIDALWDAKPGSRKADQLELLAILVEAYEKKAFPIPDPDPIEAIRFRMEQQGYSTKDLAKVLGGRNRASEVMNRKRALSLAMIRNLHEQWHIPAKTLLA